MESNDQNQKLIHSYLALRKTVGWIGIMLPFALMIGLFIFFHADRILGSISEYYYSGMRDVFVGALCSIALFLFFYRGYDNWKKINWDRFITNCGGFLAIGIAFFPMTEVGPTNWVGTIHFICAISFFFLLSCYSIFIFTKGSSSPTRQKLIRNRIYVICGLVMIASLVAIFLYFKFIQTDNSKFSFMFWGETIALMAFGISWLTKGGTLYPDKTIPASEVKNNIKLP